MKILIVGLGLIGGSYCKQLPAIQIMKYMVLTETKK